MVTCNNNYEGGKMFMACHYLLQKIGQLCWLQLHILAPLQLDSPLSSVIVHILAPLQLDSPLSSVIVHILDPLQLDSPLSSVIVSSALS